MKEQMSIFFLIEEYDLQHYSLWLKFIFLFDLLKYMFKLL